MKSSARFACTLLALALVPVACGGDDDDDATGDGSVDAGASSSGSPGSSSSSSSSSSSGAASGGLPDAAPCVRTPRADDATRYVVVSHPFTNEFTVGNVFSVHSLGIDGAVRPLSTFELGGGQHAGSIAFTPDGRIGAVAIESADNENRGAVAVFRLDDDGTPHVVHAAFAGEFYAESVRFDPDGQHLYVTDGNAVQNGGGVLAFDVACDGTLGAMRRVSASSSAAPPVWFPDSTRAWFPGDRFVGAPSDADTLHVLDLGANGPTRVGSGNVFGQSTSIRMGAVSNDGAIALFSAWNGSVGGPRVIAARLDGDTPTLAAEWGPDQGLLGGAEVVLTSPFGNAFFVSSADGDGAYVIRDRGIGDAGSGDAGGRLGALEELTYETGRPELSSAGAVITRGALRGRIVLGENVALRQFQFQPDGSIRDVSETIIPGDESDAKRIVGAIGVTP